MADLIITGPPRSGTSYLCTVLNGISNWVVLNEPPEAYQMPIKLRQSFVTLRAAISRGETIKNKMHEGKFIEDTAEVDTYEEYVPSIANDSFHLAIKAPMFLMMLLPRIIRVMPDKKKLVCVRNPIDTIASWKNSFDHLDGPTKQQAKMWARQAKRIHEHRADLQILIYEQWICDPAKYLGDALPGLFSQEQLQGLPISKVRQGKRGSLNGEDVGIIQDLCCESASLLGVAFD